MTEVGVHEPDDEWYGRGLYLKYRQKLLEHFEQMNEMSKAESPRSLSRPHRFVRARSGGLSRLL